MPVDSEERGPMARDEAERTMIIAEMAWAHNGLVENALELLRGAKAAGADALGIHVTSVPDYMTPDYRCSDGVTTSDRSVGEIYRYLERLNLSYAEWDRVFAEARACGLGLCAMCNDEPSLEYVQRAGPTMYVIAAACFAELEFVRSIGRQRKPTVLRIGGATLGEIERVTDTLRAEGTSDITLLHGIQLYPTDIRQLNLAALATLKMTFGCKVGLADHIDGDLEVARVLPLLALPYGATMLEKHITIDRALKHEDFEAALDIGNFKRFVGFVREAERSLGRGTLGVLSEADLKYRRVSRKKIVARRAIRRGQTIGREDIAFKRSDRGAEPCEIDMLIGRVATRDVEVNDGLDLDAARS